MVFLWVDDWVVMNCMHEWGLVLNEIIWADWDGARPLGRLSADLAPANGSHSQANSPHPQHDVCPVRKSSLMWPSPRWLPHQCVLPRAIHDAPEADGRDTGDTGCYGPIQKKAS